MQSLKSRIYYHLTRRALAKARVVVAIPDAVAAGHDALLVAARRWVAGRGCALLVEAAAADPPIPASEVRDELVAFLVAGHETTASALTWALWLLAGDAEVQGEVARELDEVLGERALTYADLDRLPWTRAVFDEAMRLYPPVWLVSRHAKEDDVLAGREIPAGSLIIMTPYIAQRDPQPPFDRRTAFLVLLATLDPANAISVERSSKALLFVIELAESLQGTERFLPFAALVKAFEARDGSSVLRLVLQLSGARSIETI